VRWRRSHRPVFCGVSCSLSIAPPAGKLKASPALQHCDKGGPPPRCLPPHCWPTTVPSRRKETNNSTRAAQRSLPALGLLRSAREAPRQAAPDRPKASMKLGIGGRIVTLLYGLLASTPVL
jgi:hypothetical protein